MLAKRDKGNFERIFNTDSLMAEIGGSHVQVQTVTILNTETEQTVAFDAPVRAVLAVSLREGDMSVLESWAFSTDPGNPDQVTVTVDVTPGVGTQARFYVIALIGE